jgi:hypothetical protein
VRFNESAGIEVEKLGFEINFENVGMEAEKRKKVKPIEL